MSVCGEGGTKRLEFNWNPLQDQGTEYSQGTAFFRREWVLWFFWKKNW